MGASLAAESIAAASESIIKSKADRCVEPEPTIEKVVEIALMTAPVIAAIVITTVVIAAVIIAAVVIAAVVITAIVITTLLEGRWDWDRITRGNRDGDVIILRVGDWDRRSDVHLGGNIRVCDQVRGCSRLGNRVDDHVGTETDSWTSRINGRSEWRGDRERGGTEREQSSEADRGLGTGQHCFFL